MIISGKDISLKIKNQLRLEVEEIKKSYPRLPKLVVILVGDNQASQTYVRNKERGCEYIGIESDLLHHGSSFSEKELLQEIDKLNKDDNVDGILVQLPLPDHIDEQKVLNAIDPSKDVDGFHPNNIANLFLGEESLVPCTPKGMLVLLDEIGYDLEGKEVVIVGRSYIVGKPVALLCLQKAAIGKAKFFNHEYVKDGAIVLDVGINRDENNKLCGDVDFDDVKDVVRAITPVPGGVGPMTITMLMKNTINAFYKRNGG